MSSRPPSRHISGAHYGWLHRPFARASLEQAPAWLLHRLLDNPALAPASQWPIGGQIPPGARHQHMLSTAGAMRRHGCTETEILSALLAMNERCDPPHDEKDIRAIAHSMMSYPPELSTYRPPLTTAPPETEPRVVLTPYSQIEPREIEWLWYPYIPLGRLTTVEGNPGEGKSWFALAIATQLSKGYWELQVNGPSSLRVPSATIYVSCEDNKNDTIRPRLDILGADVSKIHHFRVRRDEEDALPTLDEIPLLRAAIRQAEAKLLIIDPVQDYLPRGADMNKAEHIAPILTKLSDLAEETGCALVLLRHFRKALSETSLNKGLGSVAFGAAARSVLQVTLDKRTEHAENETHHVILQVKTNIGPKGPPLGFRLRLNEFQWQLTTMTEEEYEEGSVPTHQDIPKAAKREAQEFLREALKSGQRLVKDLLKEGKELGLAQATLYRAKDQLKLVGVWDLDERYWALPAWEDQ